MMIFSSLSRILLAAVPVMLCACGTESYLGKAEMSCNRYITSDERSACEQRKKSDWAAFEKYKAAERAESEKLAPPENMPHGTR